MKELRKGVVLLHGDCRRRLLALDDSSIDSVVTDPPYHLVSIVKRFGGADAKAAKRGVTGVYARASSGFMNEKWDGGGVAFEADTWRAVYRVLKPGGHMVVFGGTRTFHRLVCAIEDAGFEVRDSLMWLYGAGFPKSHDVSKGIDKAAGAVRTEVIGKSKRHGGGVVGAGTSYELPPDVPMLYAPATPQAAAWEGWGTALKPAVELICLARKPLSEKTIAKNVLKWGTGGLNIGACRIDGPSRINAGAGLRDTQNNVLKFGLRNIGARMVQGRWPANVIHDGSDEVVSGFPETKSVRGVVTSRPGQIYGGGAGLPSTTGEYGFDDEGSAARYFYTAKADSTERVASTHPTVKPVDLLQYLVRLVTPPGGTVLDPFAGTGTTGEAALLEGFKVVMIEMGSKYVKDIERRIATADRPFRRRVEVIKGRAKRARLPKFLGEG